MVRLNFHKLWRDAYRYAVTSRVRSAIMVAASKITIKLRSAISEPTIEGADGSTDAMLDPRWSDELTTRVTKSLV